MARFLGLANEWLLFWQQAGLEAGRAGRMGALATAARRRRARRHLALEQMEERVVLSQAPLQSPLAVVTAAQATAGHAGESSQAARHGLAIRVTKNATVLAVTAASTVRGGTAALSATLSSGGLPLGGQLVRFQVRGRPVGRAMTDAHGVATLPSVGLRGLAIGTYPTAVVATFTGVAGYKGSSGRGVLTVSRFGTALSGVSASGTSGGPISVTATLTSGGVPLAGQLVGFQVHGQNVGSAVTSSQGVATLPNIALVGVNAGVYTGGVTAMFMGGSTYQPRIAAGTLTLSKVAATVKLNNLTQTFNGLPKAVAVTTDPAGLAVGVTYTDANGNPVVNPTGAGSYNVNAAITDPNYSGQASGTLNISPAAQTLSLSNLKQTYDGLPRSVTVTTNPVGLAYTLVYTNAQGKTVANPTAVGSYHVTATIADPNYSGFVTGELVVAPAPLQVSGITANSKVYDGTTSATLNTSGATLVGVVPGDQVTLRQSGVTGAFASRNAATGMSVAVSGLTLSGAAAGNYTLVPPSVTANITPLPITGSIAVGSRVYDGGVDATITGRTLGGVLGTDSVSLVGGTATFSDKNVGTSKTVTATGLSLSGADAGNYTVNTTAQAAADITPLAITGSITAASRVYDGDADATITGRTLSGVLGTDDVSLVGGAATFSDKNVGTGKTVTATGLSLSGADAGNYTVNTTATTTADITPLAITGSITAASRVYDGGVDATINGRTLDGVLGTDDVSLVGGTATFSDKNAGTGKTVTATGLGLSGADAGNYTVNTTATTTADITPAPLTVNGVTASNKVYNGTTDAPIDVGGAGLSGVIGSDDVALDTSGAAGAFSDKNVGTGKTVTVSGLTLTGADAGNYTINATTTTMADITPLALTGSITVASRVYDGDVDATITGRMLSGVLGTDDVSLMGGTATFSDKNVGTGKMVTATGLSLSGADASNYTVNTTATTTADITPLAITGSITAASRVYDGDVDATITSRTLDGVLGTDDVSLVGGTAVFSDKSVATGKTVTATGLSLSGTDAGNYTVSTTATTTADITQASLTVSGITAMDKPSDGTTTAMLDTMGAMLVGVIGMDVVTLDVSGAMGNFDTPDMGTDKTVIITGLTIAGADAGNYSLTQPTATASIT
jgi:hypothetical protein